MFHSLVWIAVACLPGVGIADGSSAERARELVDKAIAAHGGEAALRKHAACRQASEGIFHGYEKTPVFFFKAEATTNGPEAWSQKLEGELNSQKFSVSVVLEGDRGWVKMEGNGKSDHKESTPEEIRDRKDHAYQSWLTTIAPLKDPGMSLAYLGESIFEKRAVVGIRASSRGRRDVMLYFSKEDSLLARLVAQGKAGTGKEGTVENLFSQYKSFEGAKRPTHIQVRHDGRYLMSQWVKELKLLDEDGRRAVRQP